jgi:hypothetical protein
MIASHYWAYSLYLPVLDNCPHGKRGLRQQLKAGVNRT